MLACYFEVKKSDCISFSTVTAPFIMVIREKRTDIRYNDTGGILWERY